MADRDLRRPVETGGERRRYQGRTIALSVLALVVVIAIVVVLLVVRAQKQDGSAQPGPSSSGVVLAPSPTSSDPFASSTPRASTPVLPIAPTAAAEDPETHTGGGTVGLQTVATPKAGVVVKITDFASVTGVADGVGEIGGPAIRFRVTVTNTTGAPLSLTTAVVTVAYGNDSTPANELISSRTAFPVSVAAGKSTTGTFTFTIPKADRSVVAITFDYRAGTPTVVFKGSLAP